MQIWAESGKSALPICNYSQILYQFLTFTQNLKRSQTDYVCSICFIVCICRISFFYFVISSKIKYMQWDNNNNKTK